MYKYLLFDLDDTLLDFKKAEATAISSVLERHGVDPKKETVELYSKINDGCWKRFEKGEITREEIYELRIGILGEQLGVTFDIPRFSEDYFRALLGQGQIVSGAVDILKYLRSKGYVLAAVTNGTLIIQTGRIIASGIGGFFDGGIYVSEAIGFKKPQKEFFDLVLKRLGSPAKDEVLVLGDSLSGDITGAIASGLDCCYVDVKNEGAPPEIKPTYTVSHISRIPMVCNL